MEDKYTITCDTDQSFSKTIGTNVPEKTADPTPEPVAENSLATSAAPEASPQTLHDGNAWAVSGNYFFRSYKVIDHIPSAVYNIGQNNQIGTYLEKSPVIKDGLIELADTATTDIIREFDKFWNLKDNFVKRGFVHKRGFLLWGPPGSGKTTCLNLLAERIVKERGGIVINGGRPDYLNAGLKLVRDIEVNRPVIVTIEDFDDLVRPAGAETAYLQILDGEAQINNVVFIACPSPDMPILKANLTWCRADALQAGDELIAFDEDGPDRKLRTSIVNSCPIIEKPCYRVTLSDGRQVTVSVNHPFLVKGGEYHARKWKFVQNLKQGDMIASIGNPWATEDSKEAGYLAGLLDSIGNLNVTYNPDTGSKGFRLTLAGNTLTPMDHIRELLHTRGFNVSHHQRGRDNGSIDVLDMGAVDLEPTISSYLTIGGGRWGSLRVLGRIRPPSLLAHPRLRDAWEGARMSGDYASVEEVIDIGNGPVVALDTSTNTFIGNGLLQHNTTNYPERLDRRFVDRPSRFDTIKYIGMPNAKARAQYLRYKEPDMPDDEVDYWVDLSNGFSVAHLKEMIISCKCLGNPIEDVVKRLADLHKRQPTSDDAETAEQSVGFLGSRR